MSRVSTVEEVYGNTVETRIYESTVQYHMVRKHL